MLYTFQGVTFHHYHWNQNIGSPRPIHSKSSTQIQKNLNKKPNLFMEDLALKEYFHGVSL